MKHVKSLYILSDSNVVAFPIDDIFSVNITSKSFEITFVNGTTQLFKLRLTEILNCVYDLTNFSQFFFIKEGLLINPIHAEIRKFGHAAHIHYEVVPKNNLDFKHIIINGKDMIMQLAKSKLIAQNIQDAHFQL